MTDTTPDGVAVVPDDIDPALAEDQGTYGYTEEEAPDAQH